MLHAVIMAGGVGTRFWPASRAARPKQLLSFGSGRPMVEDTLDRIGDLVPPERILIMTNAEYVGLMADLLPEVPRENILGEPACRDTAPCVGLAATVLAARDPEAVMAVMPSDHLIAPKELFGGSLVAAEAFLKTRPETLVTFGIAPTAPATGYGYIKQGEKIHQAEGVAFYEVGKFHEKPNDETARSFLDEGGFLWNSGVFVWRADTILDKIRKYIPGLHSKLGLLAERVDSAQFGRLFEELYPTIEKISIDFGVMEKAEHRAVAAVKYSWDDVGSWQSLERLIATDEDGNCVQGSCETLDATNLIVSARGGMVAAIGVEDLIIVHTPDATLVCKKQDAESVKKLVERLPPEFR